MGVPRQWNLCKRRLLMDCALFEEGNQICYSPSKHFLLLNEETSSSKGNLEFLCQLANCGKAFSSHASYECHYSLVHSRVCQTCRKNFPTNHLLDLHILEWHDTMFELQAKKQPMFQCLVESCNCKFSTRKERKNHVVKNHKYPSNYRFDQEHYKRGAHKEGGQSMEMDVKVTSPGTGVDRMDVKVASPGTGVDRMDVKVTSPGTGVDRMDVKVTSPQTRQFSYKVPHTICFGQGTSRGFQRSRGRGQGRGYKKGQHWHNKGSRDVDTHVDIEKVDWQGLNKALT